MLEPLKNGAERRRDRVNQVRQDDAFAVGVAREEVLLPMGWHY